MKAGDALRTACAVDLDAAMAADRLRQRPVMDPISPRLLSMQIPGRGRQRLVNWASNDYLGLTGELRMANAARRAVRQYGSGAGAARLLGGQRCHRRLEQRLATWLGYEDALLTTTGYQANIAVLTSLAALPGETVIVLDRLSHASSYDGARLSAARLRRFAHNDVDDLANQLAAATSATRRIVCVESVYSMDGDEAPLAAIAAVCAKHDALLVVDEAHATGVYGPGGRGCCAAVGVRPDVLVTTCSKALAAQGGVVLADQVVIDYLVN
ncbi:MAG: aminotransferase class I/II-fold pyridoxal phosphate-dependent enzyme, partial [Planctomycetota bacterium]